MDLRRGHFLVKMYAKTKELGPIGRACAGHAPLDPPMLCNTMYNSNVIPRAVSLYLISCQHNKLPLNRKYSTSYKINVYQTGLAVLSKLINFDITFSQIFNEKHTFSNK